MSLLSTRRMVEVEGGVAGSEDFAPDLIKLQRHPPSPLPRAVLHAFLALFGLLVAWACVGQLDIVAVAEGRLVPQSFLKIVQPAESGIVRDILVKEGDIVGEGQVLVRMDARMSEADSRTLQAELSRKRLQIRRVDAELAGAPMTTHPDDPPDLFVQVDAQYQARRRAYLDSLAAEEALLSRARHDLQASIEVLGKLEKTVPLYRDQAESWDRLAKEGFAGRLLALERQRAYVESDQDLKAQVKNVAGLKALVTQSERRIAQITSNYQQQLHAERAEADAAYNKLRQEWDKHQHRHSLLELRAPHPGTIKSLATHTPGTVVAPGTILLTLVPHDEPLLAEVWIANADAGFVREHQKVKTKVAAFPFQKYGTVDGTIQSISIDAQDKTEEGGGGAKAAQNAAYRALVRLSGDYLEVQGQRMRLLPGMQVSSEIHLGTRGVLEYLLSPVQKVTHEAGRER